MQSKLSDLKPGASATIIGFNTDSPATRQKMFACGLLPGAQLCLVRRAPLGDPLQIRLEADIMLSLRLSEAAEVTVELN